MKRRIVLITLCVLLLAGVVCFVLYKWLPQSPATEVTQDSFKSDADRRTFLKNFLPVSVPENATNFKFEYVAWLDWTLDGSFILPPAEFEDFWKSVNLEGKNRFKHKSGEGSFWIDESTRTIRFHANNMEKN